MSIPFSVFLIIYGVVILIVFFVSAMSVYHMLRFAKMSHGTHASVIVYLLLLAGIFSLTWWALAGVDWSLSVDIVFPTISSPLP